MTQPAAVAPPKSPHDSAQRVLKQEADAVMYMANNIPADFDAAVALILEKQSQTQGRVVICGIGKSGHIGKKIAATLASTGTPSFFVHPSEASHGDLGMVMPSDICVMISNSGETSELSDMVAHCSRFSIPLIGISKKPQSTLMRAATLKLTLPDLPEACAIGMAPTTSTTLTLALGDALAVALMEQRSFQPENFRSYHPGGKLGARLSTVAQLMHDGDAVPTVPQDMVMADVILHMTARGFGIAGVTDTTGRLTGVISDGDMRRNMDGLLTRSATEVATPAPITIAPDGLAGEALAMMNDRKITALFVVSSDGVPVGILNIHDCLRAGVA